MPCLPPSLWRSPPPCCCGRTKTPRAISTSWLELGDPERALEQLDLVLAGGPLASRDAVLHLLRARALWQAQRPDEARNALNAYLAAGGSRL